MSVSITCHCFVLCITSCIWIHGEGRGGGESESERERERARCVGGWIGAGSKRWLGTAPQCPWTLAPVAGECIYTRACAHTFRARACVCVCAYARARHRLLSIVALRSARALDPGPGLDAAARSAPWVRDPLWVMARRSRASFVFWLGGLVSMSFRLELEKRAQTRGVFLHEEQCSRCL